MLPRRPAAVSLEVLARLYCNLEARDKLWKAVQNVSRITQWVQRLVAADGSDGSGATARILWKQMSLTRKGFRLGKSLLHLEKLQNLLARKVSGSSNSSAVLETALQVLSRACLFCYAFWDSCLFLAKVKLLSTSRATAFKVYGHRFKLVGNLAGIALGAIEWTRTRTAVAQATQVLAIPKFASQTSSLTLRADRIEIRDEVQEDAAQATLYRAEERAEKATLKLVKASVDAFDAFNNSGVAVRLLGRSANDGVMGCAALVSASCVLYREWPRL